MSKACPKCNEDYPIMNLIGKTICIKCFFTENYDKVSPLCKYIYHQQQNDKRIYQSTCLSYLRKFLHLSVNENLIIFQALIEQVECDFSPRRKVFRADSSRGNTTHQCGNNHTCIEVLDNQAGLNPYIDIIKFDAMRMTNSSESYYSEKKSNWKPVWILPRSVK